MSNNVRSLLCHPKAPLKLFQRVNVVYKIGANNCDKQEEI